MWQRAQEARRRRVGCDHLSKNFYLCTVPPSLSIHVTRLDAARRVRERRRWARANGMPPENVFAWHCHLAAARSSSYFNSCLTNVSLGQVASHLLFISLAASTADSD